jgi:Protein of unknown function (DUF1569)
MKTLARSHDKTEIIRRLRELRPDSPGRWGLMTPHQMVCHLADSFRFALGRFNVRYPTKLLDRTLVKWIALYAPVPWPHSIQTPAEVDQVRGGGTKPVDFSGDVAELVQLIELVTAPSVNFAKQTHPIFGKMSDAEWLRWGYLHVDHHLRQFSV